jgi:hypothetical protein
VAKKLVCVFQSVDLVDSHSNVHCVREMERYPIQLNIVAAAGLCNVCRSYRVAVLSSVPKCRLFTTKCTGTPSHFFLEPCFVKHRTTLHFCALLVRSPCWTCVCVCVCVCVREGFFYLLSQSTGIHEIGYSMRSSSPNTRFLQLTLTRWIYETLRCR